MKWYAKKSSSKGQGLVIDADTGRNVAVAYDEKDAPLLAAAPKLLESCRELVAWAETVCTAADRTPGAWPMFDRARVAIAEVEP